MLGASRLSSPRPGPVLRDRGLSRRRGAQGLRGRHVAARSRSRRRLPGPGPARGGGRRPRLPPAGRLRPLFLPHHPRARDARLPARELPGRGDGRLQRHDRDPRPGRNRPLRASLLRDRRRARDDHRGDRPSRALAIRTAPRRDRPERGTPPVLRLPDEPSQGRGVCGERRGGGPRRRPVRPPPGHRHPAGGRVPPVGGARDLDRGRGAEEPRGARPRGGRDRLPRLGLARYVSLLGGRGRARLRGGGALSAGRGGGNARGGGPCDWRTGQTGQTGQSRADQIRRLDRADRVHRGSASATGASPSPRRSRNRPRGCASRRST